MSVDLALAQKGVDSASEEKAALHSQIGESPLPRPSPFLLIQFQSPHDPSSLLTAASLTAALHQQEARASASMAAASSSLATATAAVAEQVALRLLSF
jgi:hypothetical protein